MLKGPIPVLLAGSPLLNRQFIFNDPCAVLWYTILPPRHTLIVSPFFKTFPLARIPATICALPAIPNSNETAKHSTDMRSLLNWYIILVFLKNRFTRSGNPRYWLAYQRRLHHKIENELYNSNLLEKK
jgi:hypothetical protein